MTDVEQHAALSRLVQGLGDVAVLNHGAIEAVGVEVAAPQRGGAAAGAGNRHRRARVVSPEIGQALSGWRHVHALQADREKESWSYMRGMSTAAASARARS